MCFDAYACVYVCDYVCMCTRARVLCECMQCVGARVCVYVCGCVLQYQVNAYKLWNLISSDFSAEVWEYLKQHS